MQSTLLNRLDDAMSSTRVAILGMAKCCAMIASLRSRRSRHTRGALPWPLSIRRIGKFEALVVRCTSPSSSIAATCRMTSASWTAFILYWGT